MHGQQYLCSEGIVASTDLNKSRNVNKCRLASKIREWPDPQRHLNLVVFLKLHVHPVDFVGIPSAISRGALSHVNRHYGIEAPSLWLSPPAWLCKLSHEPTRRPSNQPSNPSCTIRAEYCSGATNLYARRCGQVMIFGLAFWNTGCANKNAFQSAV